MNRILKTLLLWLMVVALPMQATAAVVKASCGAAHHAYQGQESDPSLHATIHEHDHGHSDLHAHHVHEDHASNHENFSSNGLLINETPDVTFAAEQNQHSHSTCSACATCCVGAAAPPPAMVKAPEFASYKKISLPSATALAGFIPAGLERPPRFSLV